MILSVKPSTSVNKRYMVIYRKPDGTEKIYHFGFKDGTRYGYTYIDGADETARDNYRKRHLASVAEGKLIRSLTPSPALFSYYLLWGDSRDINRNITRLNNLLRR